MPARMRVVIAFWNDEEGFCRLDVQRFTEDADEGAKGGDAGGDYYEGCFDAGDGGVSGSGFGED